jgi:outer membrane protein
VRCSLLLFLPATGLGAKQGRHRGHAGYHCRVRTRRQAMAELRGRFEDMKGELDKQNETITKLRDELQRQSMVLSQEAKQDKELEYRRMVRDFQDQFQAFQAKMKAEEDRLSEPILELLLNVINRNTAKRTTSP